LAEPFDTAESSSLCCRTVRCRLRLDRVVSVWQQIAYNGQLSATFCSAFRKLRTRSGDVHSGTSSHCRQTRPPGPSVHRRPIQVRRQYDGRRLSNSSWSADFVPCLRM